MKCYSNPSRDAVGVCTYCGKGVCPEDAVYIDGKLYCKKCAKKVLSEKRSRKLYRSRQNRSICGVCGGLAEYADVDATLVRVVWVLVTLFTGIVPCIIVYFVMCIVVPKEPVTGNFNIP